MASTAVATRSQAYLVSCAEGIEGSKLPSVKQVFGHFLHRHNVLKEDIQTAANHTIERVEDFWIHAKILIKHRQDAIKKLEQLFCHCKGLKKNQRRQTQTQEANKAKILEMVEELFDTVHANAMKLIKNEVANCEVFWNNRSSESNDEGVCVSTTSRVIFVRVSTTSRVIFDRDVEDVTDALWLQFFKHFLSSAVNKCGKLDNPFAGVQYTVRAGCNRPASQIVQLTDCVTLGGSRDLEDKI